MAGSSPHTRGARGTPLSLTRYEGNHPRIRGEHLVHFVSFVRWTRIIPAYAGSTNCFDYLVKRNVGSSPHTRGAPIPRAPSGCAAWDHPRIRGEHFRLSARAASSMRIIPAYAGSTVMPLRVSASMSGSSPHTRGAPDSSVSPNPDTRDHPRIRGEHSLALPVDDSCLGIIPAYAGSTPCAAPVRWDQEDHPRIRGEHDFGEAYEPLVKGSSPHTRGARCRLTCAD